MKAHEHRTIGDSATGGALVDVGGLPLHFGDVVALSGDFFDPGELFAAPRDEVLCALHVMASDEGLSGTPSDRPVSAIETRVRDRFIALAARNEDHFVAPGGGAAGAPHAYHRLHQVALDEAWRLGRDGGRLSEAMAWEAAAQHFLTDAFAAGHLRTPVGAIRDFWHRRYPDFWPGLQRKVASDTAAALSLRLLPESYLAKLALRAVEARTRGYPPLSLGDLLARVFHDWDNEHGLRIDGGGVLYGDGCIDRGVTMDLAVAAVGAGVDDIDVAFTLGASGTAAPGPRLARAVQEKTGAPEGVFVAESMIPRVSDDNPPQNWRAADIATLWESPVVGTAGATVGQAVAEALEVGGEVWRRLDCLGHGLVGGSGLLAAPLLRTWIARKGCRAYHEGFLANLCLDPKGCVLAVVA